MIEADRVELLAGPPEALILKYGMGVQDIMAAVKKQMNDLGGALTAGGSSALNGMGGAQSPSDFAAIGSAWLSSVPALANPLPLSTCTADRNHDLR